MTDLLLSGRPIGTVFDLLGRKENDLTYSLGWALARSDVFLRQVLSEVYGKRELGAPERVELQAFSDEDRGYTDVEILTERAALIIEAKRGYAMPTEAQLQRYAGRLELPEVKARRLRRLVVLSTWIPTAKPKLPTGVDYLSWQHVYRAADTAASMTRRPAERHLLREFRDYLGKAIRMQDSGSNRVFVVSTSSYKRDPWMPCSFTDFVEQHGMYFHPVKWTKEPPNYIAFRSTGAVRSIHRVESAEVVNEPTARNMPFKPLCPWPHWKDNPHFVYKLGPAIRPQAPCRAGQGWRARHAWAHLDLLLTSDTLDEAVKRTKERG